MAKPYRMWMYKRVDGKTVSEIFMSDQKEELEKDGWADSPARFKDVIDEAVATVGLDPETDEDSDKEKLTKRMVKQQLEQTAANMLQQEARSQNMIEWIEGRRAGRKDVRALRKKDFVDFAFGYWEEVLPKTMKLAEMEETVYNRLVNGDQNGTD